jgi:hypothetical protein
MPLFLMNVLLIRLSRISASAGILLFSLFFLASCEFLQFKNNGDDESEDVENPLASVGEISLYPRDIIGLVPKGMAAADSADLIEQHIKSWIKKQLMIAEARKQFTFDEAELERRVLDYRYALMIHEFEKYTISRRLDSFISDEEINSYYNQNIANFELKQNIIRGTFIQINKDAPKLSHLRSLLRSNNEKNKDELKSLAFSFGTKVHMEDSVWVNFEDVISGTPLADIPNKTDFLRRSTFYEIPDEHYIYFLKINQYKIQNEISPIEFVRDDIQKIILNKRKVKLAKELEDEIYKKAMENDEFKIYSE